MQKELKLVKGLKKASKVLLLIFLVQFPLKAQVSIIDAFPELEFIAPVDLQHAGDGTNRIFVVEQDGYIKVFENSSTVSEAKIFLDITGKVKKKGEMGLLGLAFHPDYAQNGYFYVNYTTENPDRSIISRFQVSSDPDVADENSELQLIRLNQPRENHNGGQMAFGPDSLLYIAFGDGGGAGDPDNNGQNRRTLLGKIIRIDVNREEGNNRYANPNSNPFKNNSSGYREEIFAYGFRNPWRFSFDIETGKLWVADVGQADIEEINIVEPGGNYGWSLKEGTECFRPSNNCEIPGLIDPIYQYNHANNTGFSITGGYVYRGASIPELYGKYIYGDFVSQNIWALEYDSINTPSNELLTKAPGNIVSFGTDQNNELYILTFSEKNKIYKFQSTTSADDITPEEMDYSLSEAYPNPFNPSTTFSFNIPEESEVTIDVVNTIGEIITTLKTGVYQSGNHELTWNANDLASGIYFIRMNAASSSTIRSYNNTVKVVLLK